ncbi:hypothetical protein [Nonomuraea maheshkhaliensis]|uniref:hypothetical protein n=1 Tax=Nonomuraea maheshkhaliensis TaxID=419590 RepID=UPI0031F8214F
MGRGHTTSACWPGRWRLTGQAERLPAELSSGRWQREELDDRFDRVVHLPRTPART